MLHHLGNLKPTDSVLIHGGGGGVGTAALQLCQWAGVSKVWSTASAAKAEIIQSYGATALIDIKILPKSFELQPMEKVLIIFSILSVVNI